MEINSKKIKTKLFIPPAILQMPSGKTYSVKAHGEAKLLEEKDLEVPFEGKIFVEIKDVVNCLSHLHQIGAVSLLEANLATVAGSFLSQENLQTPESQRLLKDGVTLEINLNPKGAYIGPLRVYP